MDHRHVFRLFMNCRMTYFAFSSDLWTDRLLSLKGFVTAQREDLTRLRVSKHPIISRKTVPPNLHLP
jgi:hypothetical protein